MAHWEEIIVSIQRGKWRRGTNEGNGRKGYRELHKAQKVWDVRLSRSELGICSYLLHTLMILISWTSTTPSW